ncbi:MAG: hypothetical protein ACE37J_14410 [Pikeienuella sp.]|uniref:hypothetical protein n=1 Tax=Pikeienuella sp. TaxID=2831957 RepID=UPI00391CDF61
MSPPRIRRAALAGAPPPLPRRRRRIEARAEARLAEARAALDAAEARGGGAAAVAKPPRRSAPAAARALLAARRPPRRLAALAAATPDEAHALRLRINPGRVEGEFAAPDAAALAAALAEAPGFSGARLRTGARAAEAGLQRAAIELTPEPRE